MAPARTFEDLLEWQDPHLILSHELGDGGTTELMRDLEGVSRLLDSYVKAIRTSATRVLSSGF